MRLRFTKMHGLGNDFLVLNGCDQPLPEDGPPLSVAELRRLGDRHFGVGFDQMLVVQPPRHEGVDFRYRIFNADGSEVSQCGNGARCFARFVRENGLTDRDTITVDIRDGRMVIEALGDHHYRVALGVPEFDPARIPLAGFDAAPDYSLDDVAGSRVTFAALAIGNPHAVLRVADVDTAAVDTIGPALESHPAFPERVNVGFLEPLARDHVRDMDFTGKSMKGMVYVGPEGVSDETALRDWVGLGLTFVTTLGPKKPKPKKK